WHGAPPKKGRPQGAGLDLVAGGVRTTPGRQSRISAYLPDGDVGYRARGAPTSSRARVEACGSRRMRADLGPRHTGDRGASCATPSREVVPCRSGIGRSFAQASTSPGLLGPRRVTLAA